MATTTSTGQRSSSIFAVATASCRQQTFGGIISNIDIVKSLNDYAVECWKVPMGKFHHKKFDFLSVFTINGLYSRCATSSEREKKRIHVWCPIIQSKHFRVLSLRQWIERNNFIEDYFKSLKCKRNHHHQRKNRQRRNEWQIHRPISCQLFEQTNKGKWHINVSHVVVHSLIIHIHTMQFFCERLLPFRLHCSATTFAPFIIIHSLEPTANWFHGIPFGIVLFTSDSQFFFISRLSNGNKDWIYLFTDFVLLSLLSFCIYLFIY